MRAAIILLSILVIFSCDAPRENPLDPNNPDNVFAIITGSVKTVSIPRAPVSAAKITFANSNQVVYTNSSGNFNIETTTKINGWLYVEKENFSMDSSYINWNNSSKINREFFLNAKPRIDSLILNSSVINRHPNLQSYFVEVKADLFDSENDIDSVFFISEDLDINELLLYNFASDWYENSFSIEELGLKSIDQTVGKNFQINVVDKNGLTFDVGSSIIKRIIKQEIEYTAPSNNEIVSLPFSIEWKRFLPGFNFRYKLEIFLVDVTAELYWSEDFIPSSEIQFDFTKNINPGTYFWVIWCIDEFNNSTRSKPATFIIE
ncbi:MAG: hypothetical protein K9J16_12630 [Melioribacteraceae bacterium]|nr:hypothetical protein [Melioribacteraceae bacterium]MCF8356009.1 hypothetical protein [Melioribacteraceae bacterium]MCF8394680.1 hypothetical protein [Melioribacteraceae bacterium]MCF8420242.1 hypothetical protein [Melioribacteraceae bacterium]